MRKINTFNVDEDVYNTLSGIFTKAIEWGKASVNPVHKVKRFRIKERKRILEHWEQEALIIASGKEKKTPHLQAMVIFDLYTGLRKGEVKKLEERMDTCMDTWLKDFTEEACKSLKNMVPPAGIEPATPGLGNLCSILLS
jgi:hypothetical protein